MRLFKDIIFFIALILSYIGTFVFGIYVGDTNAEPEATGIYKDATIHWKPKRKLYI